MIPPLKQVLQLYPLPNATDANGVIDLYNATQILRDTEDQTGMRIDHYLSSRDSLNFRYMFLDGALFDPLSTSGAGVPGFPVGESHRTQNMVAQWTHTFSPSVVNITRAAFLRNKFLFDEHLDNTSPCFPRLSISAHAGRSGRPAFFPVRRRRVCQHWRPNHRTARHI